MLHHRLVLSRHRLLNNNWFEFPVEAQPYRAEFHLETKNNPGKIIEYANLMELLTFSISHVDVLKAVDSIEGFDPYLEAIGNETGVPLTVPVIQFFRGKIAVEIVARDRMNSCTHRLCVVDKISL